MPARPNDAAAFHDLHRDLLILPNAWDAASAKVVELAGAKAIATSSAAVAWALGHADGHHLPVEKLLRTVETIARVTALPVTADAEGGYSDDPAKVAENVTALINAGAVGINLEDGTGAHELHLKKIEAARNAGERAGVKLFINARTDVYLKQLAPAEQAVAETLKRARGIREAGASGYFVPFILKPDDIRAVTAEAGLPVNVMAWTGLPKLAELKALGVKRLSAATSIFGAAMEAVRTATVEFLELGDSDALRGRTGKPPNWNAVFGG
ncbi:MAG: isocitrate lyase/phosphoenolpyruvate mutase family protein [Hyphomonadaceae bacterium]